MIEYYAEASCDCTTYTVAFGYPMGKCEECGQKPVIDSSTIEKVR